MLNLFKISSSIRLFWISLLFLLIATDIASARENVTIDATQKPLRKVIEEISETTGYRVIISEAYWNTPITIHIQQRPLEEALKRVLGRLNHVIIYDDMEKFINIKIFDASAGPQEVPSRRMPPTQYHEEDSDRIIDSEFEKPSSPGQGDAPPIRNVPPEENEDSQ